jgi:DNA-binding beta-propeller fold protein YncE
MMSRALPGLLGLLVVTAITSTCGLADDFDTQRQLYTGDWVFAKPSDPPTYPSAAGIPVAQLFGSEVDFENLLEVDPNTGLGTIIGPVESPIVAGLAFDAQQGILFGTDTSTDNLLAIDPATGVTAVIGDMGLSLPHGGAIDPLTGTLYVVDMTSSTSTLYVVDKGNAAVTPVGPIGFGAINALDFDPTTGILYGAHAFNTAAGFAAQFALPDRQARRELDDDRCDRQWQCAGHRVRG